MAAEQVRWGVLGTAEIARTQVIPAIHASVNGTVHAVSSSSGRAEAFAKEQDIPVSYASHESLLDDPEIAAVYVPLPNSLHAQWAISAIRAGKHVLCEKPIAMSLTELDEIETACAATEAHYAEAFMYRYHPQQRKLQELIASGAIGDLVTMTARLHFEVDRSAGPGIRLNPTLGGGALRDLGCYPLDLFSSLTGQLPQDVHALAGLAEDGVDKSIAAVLRYGDVLATFDSSFDVPFVNNATLLGTRGSITLTNVFRADLTHGVGTLILETSQARQTFEEPGDQYRLEVEAFAEAILHGTGNNELNRRSRLTLAATERVADAANLR